MDRRVFLGAAGALALSTRAHAQKSKPLPRVAIVGLNASVSELPGRPNVRAFVGGLRDLGWIEGRNIVIDYRSTEGRYDEMPRLMKEVLASPVAVIVSNGPGVSKFDLVINEKTAKALGLSIPQSLLLRAERIQ